MDAAPKEVLIHTDKRDRSLHSQVHQDLVKAGHVVTPQSLNPHDATPLENITEQLGGIVRGAEKDLRYVASTVIPGDGGTTADNLDRTAPGSTVASLIIEKREEKKAA